MQTHVMGALFTLMKKMNVWRVIDALGHVMQATERMDKMSSS